MRKILRNSFVRKDHLEKEMWDCLINWDLEPSWLCCWDGRKLWNKTENIDRPQPSFKGKADRALHRRGTICQKTYTLIKTYYTGLAWGGREQLRVVEMRQGKQLKDTGRESRGDTFPTLMCVGRSTEVRKTLEIIGLFIIKLFWSFNNNSIFVAYLNWLQYQGRISKN